jgi:hypothetical protein
MLYRYFDPYTYAYHPTCWSAMFPTTGFCCGPLDLPHHEEVSTPRAEPLDAPTPPDAQPPPAADPFPDDQLPPGSDPVPPQLEPKELPLPPPKLREPIPAEEDSNPAGSGPADELHAAKSTENSVTQASYTLELAQEDFAPPRRLPGTDSISILVGPSQSSWSSPQVLVEQR